MEMITKQLYSQVEAAELLGHQVLRDAITAGWIKPRTVKKGRTKRKEAKVLYALADLERVQQRMLNGEYPEPLPEVA
jgi:hypothetical protein